MVGTPHEGADQGSLQRISKVQQARVAEEEEMCRRRVDELRSKLRGWLSKRRWPAKWE
jgi:hypothetical protein